MAMLVVESRYTQRKIFYTTLRIDYNTSFVMK